MLEMIENTKKIHNGFTIYDKNLDKIKQCTGNNDNNQNT